MKIRTVKHITFHRNGVQGRSFYSAFVKVYSEQAAFYITWEAGIDDSKIDIPSVRVISHTNIGSNWRGDEFGFALCDWFNKQKANSWYDLTTNFQKSKIIS